MDSLSQLEPEQTAGLDEHRGPGRQSYRVKALKIVREKVAGCCEWIAGAVKLGDDDLKSYYRRLAFIYIQIPAEMGLFTEEDVAALLQEVMKASV